MSSDFGSMFCLVHDSGDVLYPVKMKNRDTGVLAFRISPGGVGGNTKTIGREEEDEAIVFARVQGGWAVRASTLDRTRAGLYKIEQRCIREFKDLR